MSDYRDNLKSRHSFYSVETRRRDCIDASWKSDVNVGPPRNKPGRTARARPDSPKMQNEKHGDSSEYYKKYEHDEIPVKENTNSNSTFEIDAKDSRQASLTNSELEKLENKIYKNISQELQTDDSSVSSLESNIKFFKTTVQEIFDNFNTWMHDFEQYKRRYEEILAKNRVDSVAEMEEFIRDMIHHIMSSESSLSRESRNWMEMANSEGKDKDQSNASAQSEKQTENLLESLHSIVEAYKNENYLTDSTLDDNSTKYKNCKEKKEETFNIYLLGSVPCVQIKMNDRNLLSEINIKDPSVQEGNHVASAENIKSLAAKKQELEKYVRQQQENQAPDREIPVKVSFAKKNIYLNEDFAHERDREDNKSFMARICSYICKKFRKT